MDGNNRTVIIDVDNITSTIYLLDYAILAFTLDYQTQMLYWIFGSGDASLTITSSNVDGTNQQTILQLINQYNYYSLLDHYPPGLTVHKETLLLSSLRMNVVYSIKLGTTSETITTFINTSMLCRHCDYYQLKVTAQPPGVLHCKQY